MRYPDKQGHFGPSGDKTTLIALAAIILIAAALRAYSFAGFIGLDDAEYADLADRVLKGVFPFGMYEGAAVFPQRVGVIIPAAVIFRLFGVSELTMVIYPLVISVLSVAVAYVAASQFFGQRAGLIAAFIWALLPVEMSNATKLLPDLPSAFYASLGVLGVLLISGSGEKRKAVIFLWGLLAGASFGISWLCKESITYLAPFCLFLLIYTIRKDPGKNTALWAGVAAASIGILFTEMLAYRHFTGDWLFRFHQVEINYQQFKNGFFTEGSRFGWDPGSGYAANLAKRLLVTGPKAIFINSQFLYTPLIGLAASAYAWLRKDRAFLIPAIWLFTLAFMFNFSSSSTSTYIPLALFNRYLYPICLPAVALSAGLVERVFFDGFRERGSSTIGSNPLLKAFAAAALLYIAYTAFLGVRYSRSHEVWASYAKTAGAILKPTDRVYTDILSIRGLKFFWKYPGAMNASDFDGMDGSRAIEPGSFVLINPRAVDWLELNAGMIYHYRQGYNKPYFYQDIPASWKPVWKEGKAVLYRVE